MLPSIPPSSKIKFKPNPYNSAAADAFIDTNLISKGNNPYLQGIFGVIDSTKRLVLGCCDAAGIPQGSYAQMFGRDCTSTGASAPGGYEFVIDASQNANAFRLYAFDGFAFNVIFGVNSDGTWEVQPT